MAPKKEEDTATLHPGASHNVYMPHDKLHIKTKLAEIAKKENRSVSEISILAFETFVDNYGKKKKS